MSRARPHLITVLAAVAATALLRSLGAQDPAGDLAALEEQRRLHREARQAEQAGDEDRAADLWAQMAALSHLVPLPGEQTRPSRDRLWSKALAGRSRREQARAQRIADERIARHGTACAACEGRCSKLCTKCNGKSFVLRRIRGRSVRVPCRPLVDCSACKATGRTKGAGITKALARVHKSAIAIFRAGNGLNGLPAQWRKLAKVDVQGFVPTYTTSQTVRDTVPRVPLSPSDLDAVQSRSFESAWKAADWVARYEVLRGLLLEGLVYRREVAFVLGRGTPPISRGRKAPPVVDALVIQSDPTAHVGRWVTLEATLAPAPDSPMPYPFDGRLHFEGIDPWLLAIHAYTEDDRERLLGASRSGLLYPLHRLADRYPAADNTRTRNELATGARVRITGRLLARPDAVPATALEVWDIEPIDQ